MSQKVALIILDGWGHGKKDGSDAISNASTPFVDSLYQNYPWAELRTDGEHVGLPTGQMGNSEVGHMNIGAGRIVYQDLAKINLAVEDRSFFEMEVLSDALERAKEDNQKVHFMGLLGYGGVHASQKHLLALADMASGYMLENCYIHAFTDGRDTDPKSALAFMEELEGEIEGSGVEVASVIGRYYAMDRDQRWERVKEAYDLLTKGEGEKFSSSLEAIQSSYDKDVTDEFIRASVICEDGKPKGLIEEGDLVICFNFRTDRCREISQVLSQQDFPDFGMKKLNLDYITMTRYDESFEGVDVVFEKDNLSNTLGEHLASIGKTQIRIAETEKYPHVSFFFSGGREENFDGEKRIMVNSPKVATYDLQPEMSALEVRDKICAEIEEGSTDFICLNFANADMVGHTGVFPAIVSACEAVDSCLKSVVEAGLKQDYSFVIIADHGNADCAVNTDGSPNTAHTKNPVPVFVIDKRNPKIENGILADVAPSILSLMGEKQPEEMTGKDLLSF